MKSSVFRAWPWICGASVVAALVIGMSWMAAPQVFRTSAKLRVMPPDDPQLWDDSKALKRAIDAEGQRIIAVVMGGEVKEIVGRSKPIVDYFDLPSDSDLWRRQWSEVWQRRVMVAGPVDGEIFLIVDDENGDRGSALAGAILEGLEVEWRRRAGEWRQERIDRLDQLISRDMERLGALVDQVSDDSESLDQPHNLAVLAERDLIANQVAESRVRRSRLESTDQGPALPWLVVGNPFPFEYQIKRNPRMPVVLSALAFVFLVGVGWVAFDSNRS